MKLQECVGLILEETEEIDVNLHKSLYKGFLKDKKVYGNDTVSIYEDVFGLKYRSLFESFNSSDTLLTERDDEFGTGSQLMANQSSDDYNPLKKRGKRAEELLAKDLDISKVAPGTYDKGTPEYNAIEKSLKDKSTSTHQYGKSDTPRYGHGKGVSNRSDEPVSDGEGRSTEKSSENSGSGSHDYKEPPRYGHGKGVSSKSDEPVSDGAAKEAIASIAKSPKKQGFWGSIGEKIGKWGDSIKEKFPKIGGFIHNGLDWVVQNPLIVLGVAGGSILLTAVGVALRKKGKIKEAKKLEMIVAKKKEEEAKSEEKK